MNDRYTITLPFADNDLARQLFGEHNAHLQRLAEILDVRINTRGTTVFVEGERPLAELSENLLNQLYALLREGYPLHPNDVEYAARMLSGNERLNLKDIFLDTVYVTAKKSVVTPKSPAQKAYIDAIRTNDIVFGIGPAGTGKTYLAMAMAVASLTKGQVSRIILTRPAVEAGETPRLSARRPGREGEPLPAPALRRAVRHDGRSRRRPASWSEGVIEVAPLAFMRGRTLNDSFIILDEAQNTTSEQMKMFLTRLGFDSKAVITGDITQIDLPRERTSGLIEAKNILQGIEGIGFVYFTKKDVVRHRLVQEIIRAYEDLDARRRGTPNARGGRTERPHVTARKYSLFRIAPSPGAWRS